MRTETQAILHHRTTTFWWESMTEFVEASAGVAKSRFAFGSDWFGESYSDVLRKSRTGDSINAARADGLLEDLVLEVETPAYEWQYSIAGPRPCIPSALAGRPDSMRRRVEVDLDHAPVIIAVDVTSSGGIDPGHLLRRGISLLAMTMAIAKIRPVELYALSALGGQKITGINAIRVGTTPLDLSLACYALSSQGLCRGFGYSYLQDIGKTEGGWAWGLHPVGENRAKYGEAMRQALGSDSNFKFIPPIHLADELMTNPGEFIRRSIREIQKLEE